MWFLQTKSEQVIELERLSQMGHLSYLSADYILLPVVESVCIAVKTIEGTRFGTSVIKITATAFIFSVLDNTLWITFYIYATNHW